MKGCICVRCKRMYDFDLYSGLCPHCGCFHRKPGVSLNGQSYNPMGKTVVHPEANTLEARYERHIREDKRRGVAHDDHKTVSSTPASESKKKMVSVTIVILWIIIVALCTMPDFLGTIFKLLIEFIDSI